MKPRRIRVGLYACAVILFSAWGVSACVDREAESSGGLEESGGAGEPETRPAGPASSVDPSTGAVRLAGQQPGSAPASSAVTPPAFQPRDLPDLVEKVMPAVVNIYTANAGETEAARRRLPQGIDIPEEAMQSLGSGFVISIDGYILTNNHVVEGASLIKVKLSDDREFKAEIIGTDPKTDIALIKVTENDTVFVPLELGDSAALRVGEPVVAIGNPLGLSGSVTSGIVSARGRTDVPLGGEISYKDFIQTDASINPGNSGGALINLRGEVIGINTAISRQGQGIGFAIPINMAKDILPQLMTSGRVVRSWIGLHPKPVPLELAETLQLAPGSGAMIDRVFVGGPAHQAGLKADDVILSFNGHAIEKYKDMRWLASTVGVGKRVEIGVMRAGEKLRIELVTEENPN